ncbi:Acetyl-CoA carboxylase [Anopheles sinensis]|uniref:Acetyl-CoA carboxylase n=1 Tax=Anopheles sinensis TaxID=74873 RepID=A0A084WE38_ANOSI|nr:Acetyl-CoA carboxylase [Anopheles sinensis]
METPYPSAQVLRHILCELAMYRLSIPAVVREGGNGGGEQIECATSTSIYFHVSLQPGQGRWLGCQVLTLGIIGHSGRAGEGQGVTGR